MAYSAVAMPSSLLVKRRRSAGSVEASLGRASITLVRRVRKVVRVGLLMVVLLWSVGTSTPPLPNGRRARPTSIGPPRAAALRGLSALWRPPAVPALWHRGPPEPWPIGVDGSPAGAREAMAGCHRRTPGRGCRLPPAATPSLPTGDIPRSRGHVVPAGGIRRRRGQQSRPPTRETSPAGRKCPQPRRRPPPGRNQIGAAAQLLGDGRPTAAPDDVERLSPR